jgi:hypothetical protein
MTRPDHLLASPDFVRLQAHLPELMQAICAYARSASG